MFAPGQYVVRRSQDGWSSDSNRRRLIDAETFAVSSGGACLAGVSWSKPSIQIGPSHRLRDPLFQLDSEILIQKRQKTVFAATAVTQRPKQNAISKAQLSTLTFMMSGIMTLKVIQATATSLCKVDSIGSLILYAFFSLDRTGGKYFVHVSLVIFGPLQHPFRFPRLLLIWLGQKLAMLHCHAVRYPVPRFIGLVDCLGRARAIHIPRDVCRCRVTDAGQAWTNLVSSLVANLLYYCCKGSNILPAGHYQ
jgi:hypothetical protein